jgi:hypothetical protein
MQWLITSTATSPQFAITTLFPMLVITAVGTTDHTDLERLRRNA